MSKRLTPQEIKEIRCLFKKGQSTVELGKKYGMSHSAICYQTKDIKGKLIRRRKKVLPIPKRETPDFIKKNLAEQKKNKIKPKVKKGYCVVCGKKIKDKKFILTNYCSLTCLKKI